MTDDEIKQLKDEQQAEEILDILSDTIIKVPRYLTASTTSGHRQFYSVIVGIDEIPAAEFYRNKHNGDGQNED